MKKTLTLCLAVSLVFFHFSSFSQITRQYQDQNNAETTIVIKENKAINDFEVLDQFFDMDDVPMGQVIKITTEHLPPTAPAVEKENKPEITVVSMEDEVVAAEITVEEDPISIQQISEPGVQMAQVTSLPQAASQVVMRSGGGNYPIKKGASFAGKLEKKRVKGIKAKSNKKQSQKCVKF